MVDHLQQAEQLTMIELREVSKQFGKRVVFQHLSLKIPKGVQLCLIGSSGAGKSVIGRLIVGLEVPDAGDVVFEGESMLAYSPKDWSRTLDRFGVVFQGNALFDSLSIRENVGLKLDERKDLDPQRINEAVSVALHQVGLDESILNRCPEELSGGMQKRVGIARAIVHQPEYLIYDEPTTGLDPINASRIDDLIASLNKQENRTSIIITHDLHSMKRLAEQVVFLLRGQVHFHGETADFLSSKDQDIRAFLQRDFPG